MIGKSLFTAKTELANDILYLLLADRLKLPQVYQKKKKKNGVRVKLNYQLI